MADGGLRLAEASAQLSVGSAAAQQPPAVEPVAIVLPDTITPGLSKVEVDVNEGSRLQMLVPEQARPGDRLVFTPEGSGYWGCSILRPSASGSSGEAGLAAAPTPCRRSARQLEVLVPADAKAGEKLEVDVDGETLVLSVPECARPGDRLRLTEDPDGQWRCQLEQRRPGGVGSQSCCARVVGDELFCLVPPDAKPGVTSLRLSPSEADSHPVVITVPKNALPGDELAMSRKDGAWSMRIIRERPSEEDGPVSLGPRRNLTLCRVTADPNELFKRLVGAATAAGAWCSSKIARGATPPLDALGMIVTDAVAEGEELARIPASMHLSNTAFKERMPELHEAVAALNDILAGRGQEAAHAACVARLLQDTAARSQQEGAAARTESEEPGRAGGLVEPVWDAYARSILCEDWEAHPYWCSIEDPVAVHELLTPSREQEYLATMAGDIIAMHDKILTHVSPELLGPNFDLGFFLQARLCILTRVFQLNGETALVPVNDCVNHSVDPGLMWQWDEERKEMVLFARRAHAAGEQGFISYGRRSNVLLFRTYGFTLPPQVEQNWTYIAQCKGKLPSLFRNYLPERLTRGGIHLESNIVQDSLIAVLNACADGGRSAEAFLREVCEECLEAYEHSEALQPALQALRRARSKEPSSAAWWAELSEGELLAGRQAAEGALRGWEEHVLRVQMSEYLCLTAHVEVVDVLAGRLTEEQCLDGAKNARSVLVDGLKILRSGGRFSCNLDCPFPASMIRGLT